MVHRIDVVWDVYKPDSLKSNTRKKRGVGVRRQVKWTTRIPGNWRDFLQVNENKSELFALLAEKLSTVSVQGKQIITTMGTNVLCSPLRDDRSALEPCSHEEADTRRFVHVAD